MQYDFGYDFGETVYFIYYNGLAKQYYINQGVIQGFSIRRSRRYPPDIDVRVDFRQYNGIPIEHIFRTSEEAETVCAKLRTGGNR